MPPKASDIYVKIKEHYDAVIADLYKYIDRLVASIYQYIDKIQEIFDVRMEALEKAALSAAANIEKAITLANASSNIRLNIMNEFRATIDDYVKGLVTRLEFSAHVKQIEQILEEIKLRLTNTVTRDELDGFKKQINSDVKSLEISRATLDGKASQQTMLITLLIAVVGMFCGIGSFFAAMISIILRLFGL